jgi:hypothetical protein
MSFSATREAMSDRRGASFRARKQLAASTLLAAGLPIKGGKSSGVSRGSPGRSPSEKQWEFSLRSSSHPPATAPSGHSPSKMPVIEISVVDADSPAPSASPELDVAKQRELLALQQALEDVSQRVQDAEERAREEVAGLQEALGASREETARMLARAVGAEARLDTLRQDFVALASSAAAKSDSAKAQVSGWAARIASLEERVVVAEMDVSKHRSLLQASEKRARELEEAMKDVDSEAFERGRLAGAEEGAERAREEERRLRAAELEAVQRTTEELQEECASALLQAEQSRRRQEEEWLQRQGELEQRHLGAMSELRETLIREAEGALDEALREAEERRLTSLEQQAEELQAALVEEHELSSAAAEHERSEQARAWTAELQTVHERAHDAERAVMRWSLRASVAERSITVGARVLDSASKSGVGKAPTPIVADPVHMRVVVSNGSVSSEHRVDCVITDWAVLWEALGEAQGLPVTVVVQGASLAEQRQVLQEATARAMARAKRGRPALGRLLLLSAEGGEDPVHAARSSDPTWDFARPVAVSSPEDLSGQLGRASARHHVVAELLGAPEAPLFRVVLLAPTKSGKDPWVLRSTAAVSDTLTALGKHLHVPFRSNSVTMLLQPALAPPNKTVFVTCVQGDDPAAAAAALASAERFTE